MEKVIKALERVQRSKQVVKPVGGSEAGNTPAHNQMPGKDMQYTHTRSSKVPLRSLAKKRVISPRRNGIVENAYKVLRTQVLRTLQTNSWNTFGVVSTKQNEGKTLTAINLAISIAQEVQHTVLLVDLDLRNPSLHQYFDYKPEYGLGDYLYNDQPLQDTLFTPGIDGLVVLPCRQPIANSSEVLSSPKLVQLVEELKSRYPKRVVVFDLPSLLDGDDVLAFSPHIDSILMVIEDGMTGQEDLLHAMDYLKEVELLGTVLNKSSSKAMLRL